MFCNDIGGAKARLCFIHSGWRLFMLEYSSSDPKDGDLCLSRVKPEETLVEACRDTDVQIVRYT